MKVEECFGRRDDGQRKVVNLFPPLILHHVIAGGR